ncbi:MAG: sporulation protein YabP [Agathobaculum sp.]|uniref:sporulation protein YabP n=1 Tax=Agathobaculum sp. TaxID=2048138 RepID=UPI0025B8A35A|nr:sporulation protein YabP [Agathobaculum sp.]MCI7126543.1 sporulation protein YabP [Agathobaculum sp.]MDY3712730.1 sporulation protein YabP [Agathobaculum sp.]
MAADERSREMPHTVILEGREKLSISGVTDVQSFDEEQVLLETVRGMLVVRGQGLHVERLQLESGELIVEGEVGCIEYDDSVQPRGGLLARLFGGGGQ